MTHTPLMAAIVKNRIDVISTLLAFQAYPPLDVNKRMTWVSRAAPQRRAFLSFAKLIRLLLFPLCRARVQSETSLMAAARLGRKDAVALLLTAPGIDTTLVVSRHFTCHTSLPTSPPLRDRIGELTETRSNECDILQYSSGDTAAERARKYGHVEVAEMIDRFEKRPRRAP